MSKKLCGTLFVYNGNRFDYSYKEAIRSLLDFCDYVIVAAGGDDNTLQDIIRMNNKNIFPIGITKNHWDSQRGREKLSYFTNIAIEEAEALGYEYSFNLQADEVVKETCYDAIRQAVETRQEAFFIKRINLWKSPYLQLNVEHNRKPCSTEIIRLAKTKYKSYDDAESLAVSEVSLDFLEQIRIYHTGFVRKREVMKDKIINMQCDIFGMADYDQKLNECDVFNPDLWFDPKEDLKPIDEPLPKLIQRWAKERVYDESN